MSCSQVPGASWSLPHALPAACRGLGFARRIWGLPGSCATGAASGGPAGFGDGTVLRSPPPASLNPDRRRFEAFRNKLVFGKALTKAGFSPQASLSSLPREPFGAGLPLWRVGAAGIPGGLSRGVLTRLCLPAKPGPQLTPEIIISSAACKGLRDSKAAALGFLMALVNY